MQKNYILSKIYYFTSKNSRPIRNLLIVYLFYKFYQYIRYKLYYKLNKNSMIKNILRTPIIGNIVKNKLVNGTKILEDDLKNSYRNLTQLPVKSLDDNGVNSQLAILPDSNQDKDKISGIIRFKHKNRLAKMFQTVV